MPSEAFVLSQKGEQNTNLYDDGMHRKYLIE